MIAPVDAHDSERFIALHNCANAISTQIDVQSSIANLNREFDCKTIDETLSIAEKILVHTEGSSATAKYSQFQHDFKIIKTYSSGGHSLQNILTSTQEYAIFAFQYLTFQRFNAGINPNSQSLELMPILSLESLTSSYEQITEFLHDFAPETANSFKQKLKNLLKMNLSTSDKELLNMLSLLHENLCTEVKDHLVEMLKIIRFRVQSLDLYVKGGCYTKLFQIIRDIKFLNSTLSKDKYLDASFVPTNVIEIFENGGSKGLDDEASQLKSLKLLSAQAQIVEKALKDNYVTFTKTRCNKIIQFIKGVDSRKLDFLKCNPDTLSTDSEADKMFNNLRMAAIDLLLDKMKLQIDFIQADREHPFQVCEVWQSVLLSDSATYMNAVDFANEFCKESEHQKKLILFHNFLEKWMEHHTPSLHLDADALIILLKSLLLHTKSPELLVELILLEDNAIGLKSINPATNAAQEYSLTETSDGSGIFYYHYLNLTTALLDICHNPARETEEISVVVKRGKMIIKIFDTMQLNELFPNWISPEKFDEIAKSSSLDTAAKSLRLLSMYEQCKRNLEQAYWYRLLDHHVKIMHQCQNSVLLKWQSCLIRNPDFINEAKNWAAEFKRESNAILKMNQHHLMLKTLLQNYPPIGAIDNFEHLEGLLLALVIASDDPSLITEILLLDRNALAWEINLDSPVNHRLQNFDLLKNIILLISKPPAKHRK